MRRILILLGALTLAAPASLADYAVLRSGQRLHIAGYERQGANFRLYVSGGSVVVPVSDVVRFEPEDVFPAAPAPVALPVPFGRMIQAAAARSGVDEKLISSVIAAESNFRPHAVSAKRALGLMQLLPETAARYAVQNAFDPRQNILGGTRYLKDLLGQYHGNVALALAAYNAGPERVAEYGGVPPFPETIRYIQRVSKNLQELQQAARPASGQ